MTSRGEVCAALDCPEDAAAGGPPARHRRPHGDRRGVRRLSDVNRRVDLLCLSRTGDLVVVELELTHDGGHMELQALRYAAFVSTMTYEQVVVAHERLCEDTGLFEPDTAGERIAAFLGDAAEVPALATRVRVILVSADFGIDVTSTVLWLNTLHDMDIRCVRLDPYRLGGSCCWTCSR